MATSARGWTLPAGMAPLGVAGGVPGTGTVAGGWDSTTILDPSPHAAQFFSPGPASLGKTTKATAQETLPPLEEFTSEDSDDTSLGSFSSDPTMSPDWVPELAGKVPLDFDPQTDEELILALSDPMWRLCSGKLYKIMVKSAVKGEDGLLGDATIVPFIPNLAQRRFIARLWHRNIILKARQLGFTTLVCIMWLDHALFTANQRCGIVAQDREAAEAFFRDKVKLAYERLPQALLDAFPLRTANTSELLFAHNNSSIRVATSMRSGTIHRLHISEFGKIGAEDPAKAKEVVTGSLPAVPLDGVAIIESTAEGQDGEFYKMTQRAIALSQSNKVLTARDFRFHFFPWWQDPNYVIEGDVPMSPADVEYFETLEAANGIEIRQPQRNWYVATRDSDFSGEPEKMWQEYPSTASEAFQVSTEGVYYATQLAAARKEGRITRVPYAEGIPVNTFWDIGNTDGTAIWFHQRVGFEDRFINFMEGWGESYSYFIQKMQAMGYVWGTHYLPHDAAHKRQQGLRVASPMDELSEFGIGGHWEIVPAVDAVIHGIQATRMAFSNYWFDAEKCKEGLAHIAAYRKTWNKQRGGWNASVPSKVEGHSEAADALRQHGQGYVAPARSRANTAKGNWRTA
jgi:hypothetical protein